MGERKIKGTLIVPLAMIINARRELDWQKEAGLTDQELMLIEKGIMASAWYDQQLWEKMGLGAWKLIGKGTPEGAYEFGYGLFASLYNGTFFSSGTAEFQPAPEGGLFRVAHPEEIPIQECYAPFFRGFLARMVQENKGEKVRVECPEEALADSQKLTSLTYRIFWEKK